MDAHSPDLRYEGFPDKSFTIVTHFFLRGLIWILRLSALAFMRYYPQRGIKGIFVAFVVSIAAWVSSIDAQTSQTVEISQEWLEKYNLKLSEAELAALLGWWRLDKVEASKIFDSSSYHRDGQLEQFSSSPLSIGLLENSLSFDPKSHVTFGNKNFDISKGFTFSAWFLGGQLAKQTLVAQWKGEDSKSLEIRIDDKGRAQVVLHSVISKEIQGTTDVLNLFDNQFHHVAVTWEPSSALVKIFVDGYPEVVALVPEWNSPGKGGFSLGNASGTSSQSTFTLDEVSVFGTALSLESILKLPVVSTYADADGDGKSNLEEFLAGTNPLINESASSSGDETQEKRKVSGPQVIYVNANAGSDSFDGLSSIIQSGKGPKKSLKGGLTIAKNGDIISLAAGIYSAEQLSQNKTVITLKPTGPITFR
jgi:hypothetical protein